MPRLLLVTYYFPPEPVAGARRPQFLARHLPSFGWDVTVLTRARPERNARLFAHDVVEAPVWGEALESSLRKKLYRENSQHSPTGASPLRRGLRWMRKAVYFPDPAAGWIGPAVSAGSALCRTERFDAVLSTAMPISAHVVGAGIAHVTGLPWIADYRDPWTGNHMKASAGIRAVLERFFERRWLRGARAITAVPTIRTRIEALHRRSVVPIGNAFDPVDWNGLEALSPHDFALCHTGNLYDGLVSPELLFQAVAGLRAEGHPAGAARMQFYGANGGHVADLASKWGVEDRVEQYGLVEHREALAAQRRASDLLIFLKMDEATAHVLGSKVIEYCGSRRPIVAFGPRNSAMRDFVGANGLGWFASDPREARAAVIGAYERFVAGDRELKVSPNIVPNARALAAAFVQELDRIAPNGPSPYRSPSHDGRGVLYVR